MGHARNGRRLADLPAPAAGGGLPPAPHTSPGARGRGSGIEPRGRSRRLTLNYRTSRQNLAFALGVIGDASVQDLDGAEESVAGYHSTFTGPVPALRGFRSQTEEMAALVGTVRGWLARSVEPAAIGVLSRQGREQEQARQAVQEAGVAVEVLTRDGPGNPGSVKIASTHRRKGTEFSCVAIVGAEAGVVPLSRLVDEDFFLVARPRLP